MMNLRQNLIGAWIPSAGPSGYTVLDRSGYGTHLTWTSPSATHWQADSRGGWCVSTTDNGDFVATTRRIPATVAGFSVVQWVNARSFVGSPNSIDGNRGVYASGNVGPRLEFGGSAAIWVFSSNTTSGGVCTIHDCGTSLPSTGTWGCYALTHDGVTTSTTYQQGLPSGLAQINLNGHSGAFLGSFAAMRIGQGSADAGRALDGLIGGTLIFNRQLTATAIKWIYDQGPAASWVVAPQRRSYAFLVPATAVKSYLFVNRGQVIGGGTL